ncbi:hypothetical protein QUA42_22965 [Microcoleus sp. Pol11C2]
MIQFICSIAAALDDFVEARNDFWRSLLAKVSAAENCQEMPCFEGIDSQ